MRAGQFIQPILDVRDIANKVYLRKYNDTNFYVYQKPTLKSRWVQYQLARETDVATRKDVWCMREVRVIDMSPPKPLNSFSALNSLVLSTSGVWEHALQAKQAKTEGWCGSGHGYEELTSFTPLVDGKPVTMTTNKKLAGHSVGLIQKSNLLKPSDASLLGEVTTEWRWTPEGLFIIDEIIWRQNINIVLMYWPMVPIKRDARVSTKGRLSTEVDAQDISASGFTEVHKDAPAVTLWNDTNSVLISVESINPEVSLNNFADGGTQKTYIENSSLYNKVYFTRVQGSVAVTVDEVWRSTGKFLAMQEV